MIPVHIRAEAGSVVNGRWNKCAVECSKVSCSHGTKSTKESKWMYGFSGFY